MRGTPTRQTTTPTIWLTPYLTLRSRNDSNNTTGMVIQSNSWKRGRERKTQLENKRYNFFVLPIFNDVVMNFNPILWVVDASIAKIYYWNIFTGKLYHSHRLKIKFHVHFVTHYKHKLRHVGPFCNLKYLWFPRYFYQQKQILTFALIVFL